MSKNHLVPEVRTDKNGKAVKRLVRPVHADKAAVSTIPAPSSVSLSEGGSLAADEVLERAVSFIYGDENQFKEIFRGWLDDPKKKPYVDKLFELVGSFSDRDAMYFRSFTKSVSFGQEDEDRLKSAIGSFEFCAAIEDSIPGAKDTSIRAMEELVRTVVHGLPEGAHSPVHDGDVCALYLLERLGLDHRSQRGGVTEYYREAERIRLQLDDIKPTLPVLMELCVQKQYFKNVYEVREALDILTGYSSDDLPLVHEFVRERGVIDREAIAEAKGLGTVSLSSGAL